jgi:hypothetical protein
LKINSNKIISKRNKRNPLEILSFFWKNGSHSEMEISGCDISITIRGVDFSSNLILLDSKGIDIIHGMDWLSKYDGVIQCTRKAVRLTKKDGATVEFVAMVQSDQGSMLNQTKAIALEDI